jgi:hypothetical protein
MMKSESKVVSKMPEAVEREQIFFHFERKGSQRFHVWFGGMVNRAYFREGCNPSNFLFLPGPVMKISLPKSGCGTILVPPWKPTGDLVPNASWPMHCVIRGEANFNAVKDAIATYNEWAEKNPSPVAPPPLPTSAKPMDVLPKSKNLRYSEAPFSDGIFIHTRVRLGGRVDVWVGAASIPRPCVRLSNKEGVFRIGYGEKMGWLPDDKGGTLMVPYWLPDAAKDADVDSWPTPIKVRGENALRKIQLAVESYNKWIKAVPLTTWSASDEELFEGLFKQRQDQEAKEANAQAMREAVNLVIQAANQAEQQIEEAHAVCREAKLESLQNLLSQEDVSLQDVRESVSILRDAEAARRGRREFKAVLLSLLENAIPKPDAFEKANQPVPNDIDL